MRSRCVKWLVVSLLLFATHADARPKATVVAVPLEKPAADLDAACAAWTTQIEVETNHALACTRATGDEAPVRGATGATARGAITRAEPFFAEGLDMHCGLAITTPAGVFLPPVSGMFGCGSQRSRSDWELRQTSLTVSKVAGVLEAIWVVSEKQTADPLNIGGTGPIKTYRATNIVVCRAGDRPACAVIRRDGVVTLARVLRETSIDWSAAK